nr:hypothetical protein Itr_chr06CG17540 [Ipomoea trifida]GMD03995.1 hypothetical protein Iba_chr06aCG14210 [Ipomoea batatas]
MQGSNGTSPSVGNSQRRSRSYNDLRPTLEGLIDRQWSVGGVSSKLCFRRRAAVEVAAPSSPFGQQQ